MHFPFHSAALVGKCQTLPAMGRHISLTPCFSWVKFGAGQLGTVSTVSTMCGKPFQRFLIWWRFLTQLKQGVNESGLKFWSRSCEICVLAIFFLIISLGAHALPDPK